MYLPIASLSIYMSLILDGLPLLITSKRKHACYTFYDRIRIAFFRLAVPNVQYKVISPDHIVRRCSLQTNHTYADMHRALYTRVNRTVS
jgi:hypothetical protein